MMEESKAHIREKTMGIQSVLGKAKEQGEPVIELSPVE